jgi:hypothetical protein
VPTNCFPPVAKFGELGKFEYCANSIGTARHDLPFGTTSTQTTEPFMKMRLLAAAFAGLCSQAAFADPEADFWQQVEPKSSTRLTQPCTAAANALLSNGQRGRLDGALARYDGGDTWSALEPESVAPSTRSLVLAATAPLSSAAPCGPKMKLSLPENDR